MRRMIVIVAYIHLSLLHGHAQTIDEVRAEIKRQKIPHPEIVLAQARLETGNFKSRRCKEHHNLFGLKRGRHYARYKKWQDSIRDYKKRVSSRYKGGDYYFFLRRIKYAEDSRYCEKVKCLTLKQKKP